jgi:hypothetical protein
MTWLCCAVELFAGRVYGQSFLFPGASSSFESGLSQTNTRGAAAVATNPANTIITKKIEAYGDISLLSVSYTYQRPNFAPAKIATTAPPVDFGASYKLRSNLAIGIFMTPRPALSSQKIKSVPFLIGGDVLPVDVEQKSASFFTGIGGAYKINKATSLGLSILETAEDSQIIVRQEGTTDDANALVGMRYKGSSTQFLFGFRTVVNKNMTVAGSLKTPVTKKYSGTQIIKGDEDNGIRKKGYSPLLLSLGGEYRFGAPAAFTELRYEGWSSGRSSVSSGLPGSTSQSALNNLIILVAGGRLKFSGERSASASIGFYPHNVGFGSSNEEIASGSGKSGVQFGDFDALDRTMISAAYRRSGKKLDFTAGFNYISGSRTVPSSYPGSGKYSLTVLTVGAGGSFYF